MTKVVLIRHGESVWNKEIIELNLIRRSFKND